MPVINTGYTIAIRLFGTCIDQETVNVFHYNSVAFGATPTEILTAWWNLVSSHYQNLISTACAIDHLELQEVGGAGSFGSLPIGASGFVGGDCLPPFVAWDFTYIRGAALERNGYKRFAGVPETYQASGVASATGRTQANLVAEDLAATVSVGVADMWKPVVLRRKVAHAVLPAPKPYSISGVIFSRIGSQNSRKFGHGR